MCAAAILMFIPGIARAGETMCLIVDVTVWPERVHVQCTTQSRTDAYTHITYFAAPTNDAHATRMLYLLLAAHQSKRQIFITYDHTSGSGSAFGCAPQNCVKIVAVSMK